MTPPGTILVIVTRRIGDVLLATPLIRSLGKAWPAAAIDVMVFSGTEGILSANPDIRRVIPISENAKDPAYLRTLLSLVRRYDLAVSTLTGDRPTFCAWLAGRRRVGLAPGGPKEFWKRLLLSRWTLFDNWDTHTVLMNLALADILGIERSHDAVVAWTPADEARVRSLLNGMETRPYALLHLYPKFPYKMWTREGWLAVAAWLARRGLPIVLTGGGDPGELAYTEEMRQQMPAGTVNLAGKLSLAEVGFLISRASVYAGPDTSVTHMAAALGVPTVALYGPTNPVKWAPWPKGYTGKGNPFGRRGDQRVNNVILLQGQGDCVPCHFEGCQRHIGSTSNCLLTLPASRVIEALGEALGEKRGQQEDPSREFLPGALQ